jgi:NUDIX domain
MAKAKVLESRYAFADAWLRLRRDSVLLADGRLLSPCTIFEYPDWVDVIALTAARNVVLVDQYRHAVGQIRAEFPAGVIDEREVPLAAIKRELLEETGYTSQERHRLGGAPVNPVLQTNRIHCSWRSVHKKSSSRISTRAKPSGRTSCRCPRSSNGSKPEASSFPPCSWRASICCRAIFAGRPTRGLRRCASNRRQTAWRPRKRRTLPLSDSSSRGRPASTWLQNGLMFAPT